MKTQMKAFLWAVAANVVTFIIIWIILGGKVSLGGA